MKLLSVPIAVFLFLCPVAYGSQPDRDQKICAAPSSRNAEDSLLFSALNFDFPGMEEVRKYYRQGDWEKAKIAYLEFRREKSKVKWNINPADKPRKAVSSLYPPANNIMKHLIEASMSAPQAFLGERINWQYNPVDPSKPYFTKEWTWCNLNRMPFWNTLGKAYWATLDEKYAREWIAQMVGWVQDNPVPLDQDAGETLCWRTIESGIRMSGSWMNAYYYFLFSPSFTADANATFVKGIIEHGQRLEKITLDYPQRSGNWITMECNGLGTIGILFPELKKAEEYKNVAFDRLNKELDRQVYPDGAEVELTTGYHQVSRSNFMELAMLAQKNKLPLPDKYLGKLKKMYEFNLYMMNPTGYLPPFNDAWFENATSSLKEAYEVWKDPKFLFGASLGKKGKKPRYDSYFFNYAGYYVMRSGWNYADNCLYFDAGPVGYGHEHEDMLNLFLYSKGKVLLTEPGTYSYDLSLWRRYILSTPSHNTIIVDGKEQHRADIPGSRLIKAPLKNPWVTSPVFDYGAGTYSSGYQENKYVAVQFMPKKYVGEKDTSVRHTRHVIFLKPYYYVAVDFLNGTGVHNYEAHFNLDAPDAELDEATKAVRSLRPDSVQLGLFPMDPEGMVARIAKGEMNPILGWIPNENRKIPMVVYSKNEAAPATFSTLIYPYSGNKPNVSYNKIKTGQNNLWAEEIKTTYETIALVIRRNNEDSNYRIESGVATAFNTDASLVIVREPRNKNDRYFGFYNLSAYKDANLAFNLEKASSILIIKSAKKILLYNPLNEVINVDFTLPVKSRYVLPSKKWMILDT